MKKLLLLVLIIAASASLFADFSTKGEMRTRMTMWQNVGTEDTKMTSSNIDSRFRMQLVNKFDDAIKAVWYVEVGDVVWGNEDKGGDFGTDAKNVETKQMYLEYSCAMLDATIKAGLIGVKDHRSILMNNDMAGLYVQKKFGDMTLDAALIKETEGLETEDDDNDWLVAMLGTKMWGAELMLKREPAGMGEDGSLYNIHMFLLPWYGMTMDQISFDIAAGLNYITKPDGAMDNNGKATDFTNTGFGVFANVKYKAEYEVALDLVYTSGDDMADDADADTGAAFNGAKEYENGLEIWGYGKVNDSYGSEWNGVGGMDINGKKTGITSIAASVKYPVSDMVDVHGAAGYVMATSVPDGWDEGLGTEVDLGALVKLHEKLTFDTVFSIGMPGDYYKMGNDDADDLETIFRIASNLKYKW